MDQKRLMSFLREHTDLEVTNRGHWFYAVYHSGTTNPNIAFRADFDAVAIEETIKLPYGSKNPGISHKCGHDGHSAVLCALAMEVDRHGADRDVIFIFQHAEENAAGAVECAPIIDERHISEVYTFHNMPSLPKGSVAIKDGTMWCASEGMVIHFQGTPAHASQPETGSNPAFAVADLIRLIPELIDPAANKGLVLCTVIQVDLGEEAFGVSASEGKLLLTCRGQYEEELVKLSTTLEKRAKEFAKRDGLKVDFSYYDVFPETANHPDAANRVREVCTTLNIPLIEMEKPMRSSEDMGHFFKRTKGAFFLMGTGDQAPIHTVDYDFCDDIIEPTVRIFKGLIG